MSKLIGRRHVLAASGALIGAGGLAYGFWPRSDPSPAKHSIKRAPAAGGPIELSWGDLIPGGDAEGDKERFLRIVEHGGTVGEIKRGLVTEYYGKRVRLPGYMFPLTTDLSDVRHFLLVPFVGACYHVPPPPPNQIVLVETPTPYKANDLFDPVAVIGVFSENFLKNEIADIGYSMSAEKIERFDI